MPADDIEIPGAAIGDAEILVVQHRHPERGAFRIRESRWGHADDRVRRAFDRHRLANGVAAAPETLQPEAVAEDDHSVMPRIVFVAAEPASENRPDAQHIEEAGADLGAVGADGRAAARYRQADVVDRGHARQHAILRAHVEEVRARHHRQRTARHLMEHADQSLGSFVGKRLEDDGVDHSENRRVGADAQRQRQQCDDREAGDRARRRRPWRMSWRRASMSPFTLPSACPVRIGRANDCA